MHKEGMLLQFVLGGETFGAVGTEKGSGLPGKAGQIGMMLCNMFGQPLTTVEGEIALGAALEARVDASDVIHQMVFTGEGLLAILARKYFLAVHGFDVGVQAPGTR
uniref:Uncharacterized protein n=1 Tax=Lepeophtheirus salmonis TaxID=72036 RepID=A0A0K2U9X1_LEPSM